MTADINPAKNHHAIGDDLILVQDLEVLNVIVVKMEILEAQDTNHTDQAVIIAEIDGAQVQTCLDVIHPEIVRTQKSVRLVKMSEVFPLRVQLLPALAIKNRLCLALLPRKKFLKLKEWQKLKDKSEFSSVFI